VPGMPRGPCALAGSGQLIEETRLVRTAKDPLVNLRDLPCLDLPCEELVNTLSGSH